MNKDYYVVRARYDDCDLVDSPREQGDTPSHLVTAQSSYRFAGAKNDEDGKPIGAAFDGYYCESAEEAYLEWVYVEFGESMGLACSVLLDWTYDDAQGFYNEDSDGAVTHPEPTELGAIFAEVKRWVTRNLCCLPVYLYDHSRLAMSTVPFSSRWDSGQVGYIYITKEEYEEYTGRPYHPRTAGEFLREEIRDFSSYLEGDVWGIVYAKVTNPEDIETLKDSNWAEALEDSPYLAVYRDTKEGGEVFEEEPELIDACWGYLGYDYVAKLIAEEAVNLCLRDSIPPLLAGQKIQVRQKVVRHNSIVNCEGALSWFCDRGELMEFLNSMPDGVVIEDISWEVVNA